MVSQNWLESSQVAGTGEYRKSILNSNTIMYSNNSLIGWKDYIRETEVTEYNFSVIDVHKYSISRFKISYSSLTADKIVAKGNNVVFSCSNYQGLPEFYLNNYNPNPDFIPEVHLYLSLFPVDKNGAGFVDLNALFKNILTNGQLPDPYFNGWVIQFAYIMGSSTTSDRFPLTVFITPSKCTGVNIGPYFEFIS